MPTFDTKVNRQHTNTPSVMQKSTTKPSSTANLQQYGKRLLFSHRKAKTRSSSNTIVEGISLAMILSNRELGFVSLLPACMIVSHLKNTQTKHKNNSSNETKVLGLQTEFYRTVVTIGKP